MKKNILVSSSIMPWLVCFSASLFFAYELIQLHMLNAIAPMLLKDLSLSATQFGYLSATYLLADVIFLLPAGIILDRFSTRKVILAALFFCVGGTFSFAFANSLFAAGLSHFFSGIGNAFCFLSCMMLVSRWFPKEKQALIVGLMITMGMLGAFLAQTPFSYLAQTFSWREALLIDGCIGIGISFLIFLFVKDHPSSIENSQKKMDPSSFWKGVLQSFRNFQNVACGLYTGFMNLPLMIISAVWGSLFLVQIHGIPLTKASFVISMIAMGTIVGSPLFGWISDKTKQRRPVMIIGAIASLLLFFYMLSMPRSPYPVYLALFFLLGLFTSSQVIGYALITQSNPDKRPIAAVIMSSHVAATSIGVFNGSLLEWAYA